MFSRANVFFGVIFLCFTMIPAQEISADSARTGLVIHCPQRDIPVYVDGGLVGHTPLPDIVMVNPGEHRIGFFPAVSDSADSVLASPDTMPGTVVVEVNRGYITPVNLDYRKVMQDAGLARSMPGGAPWIGVTVLILVLIVTFWGMG